MLRIFLSPRSFIKVAQFGICFLVHDSAILETLITVAIPIAMFLTFLITISLDVVLTIKAYQIHKNIEEESKPSGGHSRDNDKLKKELEASDHFIGSGDGKFIFWLVASNVSYSWSTSRLSSL